MPPVALAGMAGDERVQRRIEAERAGVGGNIVDDAVGDEDGARRRVRAGVSASAWRNAAKSLRAGVVGFFARVSTTRAHRHCRAPSSRRCDLVARLVGLRGALADAAGAERSTTKRDDVLKRLRCSCTQRGIGEPEQQKREGRDAEPAPRADARQRPKRGDDERDRGQRIERRRAEGGARRRSTSRSPRQPLHEVAWHGPDRPCSCRSAYTSRD